MTDINAKKVLIADDDPDLVKVLETRCRQLGLQVVTASDALGALNLVAEHQPDVICLDIEMPAGNGLSVCEMLATDPRFATTPVVMMTGRTDPQCQRRCHELAAYYVAKSNDTWLRLRPLLCEILGLDAEQPAGAGPAESEDSDLLAIDLVFSALGWEPSLLSTESSDEAESPDPEMPWVLVIDDDPDATLNLEWRLSELGVKVLRAYRGMEGYRQAFSTNPSAIVLDHEMPNGNGTYVLRRLMESPLTRDIPVIMLTGKRDNALKRSILGMGARAFLNKPARWEDLFRELAPYLHLNEAAAAAV